MQITMVSQFQQVNQLKLLLIQAFLPEIDEFENLINENTKAINPTGFIYKENCKG